MAAASAQARTRAVDLYRKICRNIAPTCEMYQIDLDKRAVKRNIADRFRVYSAVQDPQLIDLLLRKAEMELQETQRMWKTKSHVLDILTSPPELLAESPATRHLTPKREDAFLQDFFAGKVPQ